MNRTILKSRIGPDGVLHLNVPVGESKANLEVQVTIDPLERTRMTPEQWRTFVYGTAGSVTDPTFTRREQGEYETHEELP